MGTNDKSDHWHVGRQDARYGNPRYRFQDPHLQKEYDKGYNSYNDEPSMEMEPTARFCQSCGRAITPSVSKYCVWCRI